jgi:hypothetical protein
MADKAETIFQTRYAIIEPGPLRSRDLVSMEWNGVRLETMPCLDPGIGNSGYMPTPKSLQQIERLMFPGRKWERVRVNSFKGPTDMFVDDRSVIDDLTVNEGATLIYWTASWMHRLAKAEPSKYEIEERTSYEVLIVDAMRMAKDALLVDHETPRINGRAVLFDDQVWF